MSAIGVLPLVVLGLGLVGGIAASVAVARRKQPSSEADLRLELADLEAEREQLYERLRGDELSDPDRETLELQAARVLKRLDEIRGALGDVAAAPAHPGSDSGPERAGGAPAAAPAPGRPVLVGALMGGGLVALVAVLVLLAERDAQPGPRPAPGGGAMAAEEAPAGAGMDRGQPPLPANVAATVEQLEAELAAAPDLEKRYRLAEILLAHGQFFEAFNQSQLILKESPGDAIGHYISGVVRLTMGQADAALDHLDQALASRPDYASAAVVKGIVQLQMGNREGAVDTWSTGLQAAGGSEVRLEHLLRLTREGKSVDEILNTPISQ